VAAEVAPWNEGEAAEKSCGGGCGEREGENPRVEDGLRSGKCLGLESNEKRHPAPRSRPGGHRLRAREASFPGGVVERASRERPESGSDGELAAAGGGAGEEEIGDVGAGEEQQEENCARENQERRFCGSHENFSNRHESDAPASIGRGMRGGEAFGDGPDLRLRLAQRDSGAMRAA
jgi:hypothetical protein